ncbi:MAG: T9SS type A sorting domain-containing protein [Flavobacteriales bacterium]
MKKLLFLATILFSFSEISWGLIKFTYVSPSTNEIHIKNYGTSTVNIAAYRFCALFEYVNLSDGSVSITNGDFSLSGGEEVALTWNSSNGFNTSASDLGLYLPTGAFSSASAMVDFMQYGAAGQGRENVANAAGLWTAGTFLTGSGPWYYLGNGTMSGMAQWTSAPPVDVTFKVDMSQQTVSPNGIHLAGSMQNWDAATSSMTDDGNGIYSITFTLFEGIYQYKFINGNEFAQTEIVPSECGIDDGFGGMNRLIDVSGNASITLDPVCFSACAQCVDPVNITFAVDMSNETVSLDGIHLVGSFQNWTLPGITMTDDGNGIYTYTSQLPANSDYEFRFLNGLDYSGSETVPTLCGVDDGFGGYNRLVVALESDISLDTVCFSSCESCPVEPQDISVTFYVNMNDEIVDPNGVHVTGTFNNWDAASAPMTDVDLDGIYVYNALIPQNTQVFYKFINGNVWGMEEIVPSECALSDGLGQSRVVYTLLNDISTDTVCYASCTNCGEIIVEPSNMITLHVNMQDEVVSPNGVHVAGNFQNWDPSTFEMTDEDLDGIYSITFEADEWANLSYKFINGNTWPEAENVPSSCGLPDGNGGYNRILETGTIDFIAAPVCFSSCEDCIEILPLLTNLTFYVNMNNEVVSPNGIYVAGSFNNWTADSTMMTDEDLDGIYEFTQPVEMNSEVQYKFINGNAWGADESVPAQCASNNNRFIQVGVEALSTDTVCFASCVNCEDIVEPTFVTVVFQVDLSNETPSPQGIHVAGDFQGWNPNGTVMNELGGGIYELSYQVETNQTIHFKFINGSDWPFSEIVPAECGTEDGFGAYNRTLEIEEENLVYGPICFGSCTLCEEVVEPATVDVTFLIDMNNETVDANGVHIAGNFQNWSPSTTEMLDTNADGIYEYSAAIDTNYTVLFKFINGNDWPMQETVLAECGVSDGFGGFNRSLEVGETDLTFGPVCFSGCSACLESVPVLITFQVDMSNEIVSGDGVFIAGDFNNWDPTATQMSEFATGMYQAVVVLNSGETTDYKFINGMEWTGSEVVPADCGVNDGFGNFNRSFTAGVNSEIMDMVCFSSCTECVVVPMVDITFQLDLGQISADPAGVHVAGTFNGFSPTATEMNLAFENVYAATVSVPENSQVQFKYINGDSWINAETVPFECGTDDGQGGYNRTVTVDASDFTLPQVCFSSCADCIVNIETLDLNAFQVYPNPASNELNISLNSNANSVLTVFDAIGNLVMTHQINSDFITIDIAHLSAGVYSLIIPGFPSQKLIVE